MAAVFGIVGLIVLFMIINKYKALIQIVTGLFLVSIIILIMDGGGGNVLKSILLVFALCCIFLLGYLAIDFVFGAIRLVSEDENYYVENKRKFYRFLSKWFVIYMIFGFIFEKFLSLFMDDDMAMMIKIAIGSRVFLGLLLINKVMKWRRALLSG